MSQTPEQRLAAVDARALSTSLSMDNPKNEAWAKKLLDRFVEVYGTPSGEDSSYWRGVWQAFRHAHTLFVAYVAKDEKVLESFSEEERKRIIAAPTDEMIERFMAMLQGYMYNAANELKNIDA